MTRHKKNLPADTAWPPAGVRDLKPDVSVSDRTDHVRFPILREAPERKTPKVPAPRTLAPDTLTQELVPDPLTQQRVLDLRRRTRSRPIEYLCRAYLQFGQASMSTKDLEILCAALNATETKKSQ